VRCLSWTNVWCYGSNQKQDYLFCGSLTTYGQYFFFPFDVISVTFQPGVFTIPYPYWHSSNLPPNTTAQTLTANSLYQLELLLAQQSAPSDTAAIIVEPVLGEGGYVPAPPEFLQGLRNVCDKHGIMLIVDEVQCGFGRTGSFFAIEESGVRPDILVIAKVRGLLSVIYLFLSCH
jgi:4-aminobutyrate aminotransferase-like enzyme